MHYLLLKFTPSTSSITAHSGRHSEDFVSDDEELDGRVFKQRWPTSPRSSLTMDQSHLELGNYKDQPLQLVRPLPQQQQETSRPSTTLEDRRDSGVEETLSTRSMKLLLEELNKKHLFTSSIQTSSVDDSSPESVKSFLDSTNKVEASDEITNPEEEEENADGIVTNIYKVKT